MNRATSTSLSRAGTPAAACAAGAGRGAAAYTYSVIGRVAGRLLIAVVVAMLPVGVRAQPDLTLRGGAVEAYLLGYPQRALVELPPLVARATAGNDSAERRYLETLYADALVATGRTKDALQIADRLERDGADRHDDASIAAALLVRSSVQAWNGDAGTASALAKGARERAAASADAFLLFRAAMVEGVTARQRGQFEEALASFQDAMGFAERARSAHRRSKVRYQLSVLYLALKQPERARDEALAAFDQATEAKSVYEMAKAKMAESAALELLDKPQQELVALQEALDIARHGRSTAAESLALANLADIHLRRHDYRAAYDASRRALEIAKEVEDISLMATSKANMGFALLGLGRTEAGKRLADDALADYERKGATAEIAGLLGEYGHYLEQSGDYRTALALLQRERKLNDEITAALHDKAIQELQGRYESDRQRRDNELKSVELQKRELQQSLWWLLSIAFGISFTVVAVLYRKLQNTNRLLAQKNEELSAQSSRDPLTALYNRRHFQDHVGDIGRISDRRLGGVEKPVQALLLIDIDHFKQINDRYGHAAGDAVLVSVARRLRDALRETDMIVRWGGEEFLVFVPETSVDRIEEIVVRLMAAMSDEPFSHQGGPIRLTASIGFTPLPLPLPPDNVPISWERAIALADMALYMAKLHGRNRAYGIRRLVRNDPEALATLDHSLQDAWRSGIVDLSVLQGAAIVEQHDAGSPPLVAAH
jgi:diguanylate cyclase (GGDEF)-like protein